MDPRTQGTLTIIHGRLKENDRVKGRFMTTTSQLVNGKKYKMVRVAMMMEGRGGLGGNVGDDDHHCQQHEYAENESWLCDRTRMRRVLKSLLITILQ
jgi:hypothetical protein